MHERPKALCFLLALAAPLAAQADWSSYFGRAGDDWILAMKADALGRVYVCGGTNMATHVTANAFQPGIAGGYDAFVACLDPRQPASQQLVWATHIGGAADDTACDLFVDAAGTQVTVVGQTASVDFPVPASAWQTQHGGGIRDGFVAVFDPARMGKGQLQWASYLGGSGNDVAASVDEWNGMVTIAGTTESNDFPTLAPWQAANGGKRDVFVCRFLSGGQPLFSTYLGGSGDEGLESVQAIFGVRSVHVVVDGLGNLTVATCTNSADYPNPKARVFGPGGGEDLAVSRFDLAGRRLLYSAIAGGALEERCHELVVDQADRVLVVGRSASGDFPVTANRLQGFAGGGDGVLVHLDLATDQILYSTYLGGTSYDSPMGAYREPGGTLVVAGYSFSADYPTTPGAPQRQPGTLKGDAFLSRLRPGPTSTTLQYSTWFGGTTSQAILGIAPDGGGGVFVAGPTLSTDFPVTSNGFDTSFDGVRESWLAVHRMLPAVVTRFGHATKVCGPSTFLQMSSAPLSPNPTFAVETHDAPASVPGVLLLGTPLPGGIQVLNASLFVTVPWIPITVAADPQGFSSLPLPLPQGFLWNGQLALQSFWIAPVTCSGPLGASNALR